MPPDTHTYATIPEIAVYTGRKYEVIRKACIAYKRSKGATGLRHKQKRFNSTYYVTFADATEWMERGGRGY